MFTLPSIACAGINLIFALACATPASEAVDKPSSGGGGSNVSNGGGSGGPSDNGTTGGDVADAGFTVHDYGAWCDPNYDDFDDLFYAGVVVDGDFYDVYAEVSTDSYAGGGYMEFDGGSGWYLISAWGDDIGSDCDYASSTYWSFYVQDADGWWLIDTVSTGIAR